MFFALSKTLGVMMLPTNFLLGFGLLGVLLLATGFARAGRRLMVVAILLLALCAFSPLGSLLIYSLETRFPKWDSAHGPPDGIIVLGGPVDADLSVAYDRPVIRSSPDRIVAAAELARRYPNARIIFTGGSANLLSNDAREADYARTIFENLGIDTARLIMDRRARNSYENALFSKALAEPKPGERWLLVTSAYHMPRSVGVFRRAGFPVEPYPVDWHVGPDLRDALSFSNVASDGFARTDIAMREWIGLAAYRIAGRTSAFFPAP